MAGERGEGPEEFLDLCNKVKKMTEKRKRKHDGEEERPAMPVLQYGPIDWRVEEKVVQQEEKVVVEPAWLVNAKEKAKAKEAEAEAGGMAVVEAPKKGGKIKRRGKKKGKRNKPDREEEDAKTDNAMDC
jgi:hypothetical protein